MADLESFFERLKKKCDCLVCETARYFVIFMLFMGMTCAYIMRTNMFVSSYAMINYTIRDAKLGPHHPKCPGNNLTSEVSLRNGTFTWTEASQTHAYSAFLYGYTLTQIPFAILAHRFGAKNFLGWGMFLNSVLGFSVPIAGHKYGAVGMSVLRFLQGLCEGSLIPCTHAMLGKWVPPEERSRMCATVYAGAEFGTVIAMPVSGFLAEHGFAGGWPSTFFTYGIVGLIWSIAFLGSVYDDPIAHPYIKPAERKYINQAIWGSNDSPVKKVPIPIAAILATCPFYAILFANMGQSLGYSFLSTRMPTYFYFMLNFSFKNNLALFTIPFIAMWLCAIMLAIFADWLVNKKQIPLTSVRRAMNTVGQLAPSLALTLISFVGCNWIGAILLMTFGLGLNGATYSGYHANHLDLSPRFAGLTAAITNSISNMLFIAAPYILNAIIDDKHTLTRWRTVLFLIAGINAVSVLLYRFFSSSIQQWWNTPILTPPKPTMRQSRASRKSKARLSNVSVQPNF